MRRTVVVSVLLGLVVAATACGSDPRQDGKASKPSGPPGAPPAEAQRPGQPDHPPVAPPATGAPEPDEPFIDSPFFDVGQYVAVSKFRSCEGHDFSGLDVQGDPEAARSMKHYLEAKDAYAGSTGKLAALAPFDGTVRMLEVDQRGQRLGIASAAHPNWMLLFFHTDPAPGVAVGATVTRGQVVGHGNLTGGAHNFDVALKWERGGDSQEERWDSAFGHLTSEVAAGYAAHGLTATALVIPKAQRDAAPCQQFGRADANWVTVR